ncbi:MAG: site-specific DNA-methyltransferase [Bacteroidales bacterium]|nr:site-specific DNA-methyltransferase [Bacteroidales bacterium]
MDKQQLIEKITSLEGLSSDEKSALLALLREQKKYGLVWEDKPEDVETELLEKLPVLTEVKERAIISDDPSAPNHILIEGDNLHALTALSYTHEGKIDVIYIDPPYNTGNKDFIYNDSFVDDEDEYKHSKWLSFMNKRLVIAKKLLSEKGAIFISIDENEVGPLRVLGDEIFMAKNFVGQWNWFKSATPPALSKKIKRTVEYILCWQSTNNDEMFRGVQKVSPSNDPFTKPQNSYKVLSFPPNSISCPQQTGVIRAGMYGTDKFPNELLDDIQVVDGKNTNTVRFNNRFIWIQGTLDDNIQKGLHIELSKKGVLSYKRSNYNREVPPNFIDSSVGVDTTENAGRQLLDLFNNEKLFDYPKPISLIQYLINFIESGELTILDFFAGSGTTLHATMALNTEDGGHRQCILVTNNENGICENVTYERNKRVINGYTKPNGDAVDGLHNNTLRYYKTDFVPRESTMSNMRSLVSAATDLLCIKNDIYTELSVINGKKLKPQVSRFFENGDRKMLVVYMEEAILFMVEEIKQMEVKEKIKVYLFSPSAYPFTEEFQEVADKVDTCALPSAIYQAYKKVLPKRKPTFDSAIEEPINEEEL